MDEWDAVMNAKDDVSRATALGQFQDRVRQETKDLTLHHLAHKIKNNLGDGSDDGWTLWAQALLGPPPHGTSSPATAPNSDGTMSH